MNQLYKNQNYFFSLVKKNIKTHPYFVVLVLHEYFRSIFPDDPHIPFKVKNPIKRIADLQKQLISFLELTNNFGSYNLKFSKNKKKDLKIETGIVYGKFWEKFSKKENLNSKTYILDRFKNFKSFKKNFFKNKSVIDVGCGGGRYSNALILLGAKKVVGIDYGDNGLKLAKSNYKSKNLSFEKQNVLNIKHKDNSFDIVYSNGVIHHTRELKKGIKELVRICKPGGYIYLYLYGRGGIYWNARKKMNNLMKEIPQNYSQNVLDLIGMPYNRFIFMDNWYVPIEKHPSHKEVYKIINSCNVSNIEKMISGRSTDLETGLKKYIGSKIIWGEGEIRLLIKK